ncbi:hypothetical protein C0989_008349, partial [Termitomyces sp. Mn162]
IADAFPKKQAVPLPTATPTFTTIPGLLRNTKEELPQPCCNSRGVPLQCLPATDFPAPPSNREQPSPPIQAQLQEPPPLLRDNSAALQKTPHWSSPSALDPWYSHLELWTDKTHLRPLPPPAPPPMPTQPTNPHQVTLALTLGLPNSSLMKEPPTPRKEQPSERALKHLR